MRLVSESREIGVLRSREISEMSTCCPTEFQQIPEVNVSPERSSQQREEPGKGVIPATDHAEKTHQDIEQQCRPNLPTDGIGAVAQEIAQLQALLDLFKEHFDLPAAAIQISDTAGAPGEIVRQKHHLAWLAVDFHQSPHSAYGLGIMGAGVFVFEHHQLIAQDAFIRCLGSLLTTRKQSDSLLRVTQKTPSSWSTPRWMKST